MGIRQLDISRKEKEMENLDFTQGLDESVLVNGERGN